MNTISNSIVMLEGTPLVIWYSKPELGRHKDIAQLSLTSWIPSIFIYVPLYMCLVNDEICAICKYVKYVKYVNDEICAEDAHNHH